MDIRSNSYVLRIHFIHGVFSTSECQQIMQLDGFEENSRISGEGMITTRIRNSHSKFIPTSAANEWIARRLIQKLEEVNQTYYQFQLHTLSPLQIIRYDENGFYDWHVDLGGEAELNTRKLSLITFLSDPADYEGGQLKIIGGSEAQAAPEQRQGTLVLFPSYLLHRVEPVRRGQRKTLVMWAHGPSFS